MEKNNDKVFPRLNPSQAKTFYMDEGAENFVSVNARDESINSNRERDVD